jgi:putative ABC transport system permease protein
VRRELFGTDDPVGATVRLGRVPLRVVGVLAGKGQGSWGQDADDLILVPLETGRRRLATAASAASGPATPAASATAAGVAPRQADIVQQISLIVGRAEDLVYVEEQLVALLRQRHRIRPGDEDDFAVRNIAEMVSTRTQTTRLMSLLLGAVAGISLVVGGIGIMNIMLVSVTERIRENGLRMAVGAGPREIQRQFLAEAMLISLGGGFIGIALGIGGALLAERFGALPVRLDLDVVLLATGFSVATGLFFGWYPARKAARLDPIEALRHQG